MKPGQSIVPKERLELLRHLAITIPDGDVAEVGVYMGGSAAVLARALPDRQLWLFDSFKGLPEPGPQDAMEAGRFRGNLSAVLLVVPDAWMVVDHFPPPGIAEMLLGHAFAFVHVDCDMYQSTRDALEVFYPRTVSGGVIVLDDYGCSMTPGATEAVEEFMGGVPETLQTLHRGGAWFRRAA